MTDPITILVVDDHAVVREGLRAFLALQDDVEVVGEAADGEEAVEAVVRLEPDVALVDLVMPRVDGIQAIGRIRAERPEARVIVLTSFVDEDRMLPAVRAGAVGYLRKDVQPQDLVRAIRTVHAGNAVLAPTDLSTLLDQQFTAATPAPAPYLGLTEKEREVFDAVARGLSNAEIAGLVFASESTVKTHVGAILRKLALRDRVQIVVFAHAHGLVGR